MVNLKVVDEHGAVAFVTTDQFFVEMMIKGIAFECRKHKNASTHIMVDFYEGETWVRAIKIMPLLNNDEDLIWYDEFLTLTVTEEIDITEVVFRVINIET